MERPFGVKAFTRTSIEAIRRRELIEAAYSVFVTDGLDRMTMARIGERAGMSRGIVNYYFKSKTDLLAAVMRKSMFIVFADTAKFLREATTPRERLSAVVRANLIPNGFTQDAARAWFSFYSLLGNEPEFDRMQTIFDVRTLNNYRHALRALVPPEEVDRVAVTIATLVDGLWVRQTRVGRPMTMDAAIAVVEGAVDAEIARAALKPCCISTRTV
ncbi:MAG: transcriptional regulator BetI [Hyphomicrobiales bacterium]